jgi:hypothetical protein
MNLRDLWDNVVLRDILGYIVPGAVTLYAFLLLAATLVPEPSGQVSDPLDACAGLLRSAWPHLSGPYLWLALGLTAAAAYAFGHLQAWIIDLLEKPIPSWNLGHVALRYLQEEDLGRQYAMAAFQRLRHMGQEQAKQQPLLIWLSNSSRRCSKEARDAEGQAEDLWRLCDRYALLHSPNAHSIFMGRYYILAVYFSNLGLSATILGLCALATHPVSDAIVWVAALVILLCLGGFLAMHESRVSCALNGSSRLGKLIAHSPVAVVSIVSLCALVALPDHRSALLSLGLGALMIARSGYFRGRFVECTFPIFYAIVQAEERSKANGA